MRPPEPLDDELARASSLHGKVVFVVATYGSGADLLVRALGELPGVAALPVQTALFSQGMHRVLDHWVHDASTQGFHYLCEEQEFLLAARLLADAPLEAALATLGGDVVVEYSPGHILALDDIRALYPDASVVHVVRDGRHVAERLTHGMTAIPARHAARRWIDDQREALAGAVDGTVRMEAVMADPAGALAKLAAGLGLEAGGPAMAAAASHFRGAQQLVTAGAPGRAAAIVEIVGPDLLLHFGYEPQGSPRSARVAAWAEIAGFGAVAATGNLRRRLQQTLAARFGSDAWRPTA
jgi:hypothetical protein